MVFHHIEITKTGTGISGGEICLLGLVQQFRKHGRNIVYTSENGVDVFKKNGADFTDIQYVPVGKYEVEKRYGILASWFYKTLLARKQVCTLDSNEQHVMISHSDFFPSVLFAYWMKKRNPSMKWMAFCHMLAPNPFKGNKWQFVKGKIICPSLRGLYFWFSQRFFFKMQQRADALISVNSGYESYLKTKNPHVVIISCCADSEVTAYAKIHDQPSSLLYDLCFLGRFHEQKGVLEFVNVVHRIVKKGHPNVRSVMIGDHQNPLGDVVRKQISLLKLDKNIELLGLKMGAEKCQILKQSNVFLFPSYYESFGIVYLEAITLGVPVVEYDLPIYRDHKAGVVKVPYLNNEAMAKVVIRLLEDPARREQLAKEGRVYSSSFDWANSAETILKFLH